MLLKQLLGQLGLADCLGRLGLIARQSGFRLPQRRLIGPPIDPEKHCLGRHRLAGLDTFLADNAADLRLYLDLGKGLDRTKAPEFHRHRLLFDHRHPHRHRRHRLFGGRRGFPGSHRHRRSLGRQRHQPGTQ